jgi:hypothetical protein
MPFVSGFLPSTIAPLFGNGPWPPGTTFTISVMGLPVATVDATHMGFCGGMSFLTRDIFQARTPQLRSPHSSQIPLALAGYIFQRLIQSFDGPAIVGRWLALTQALDHDTVLGGAGVFHQTVDECPNIITDIELGRLCPIGVVLAHSWNPADVFNNHVVLVWGHEISGSQLTLHTYDCNRPGRDDIIIQLDISSETPAKVISTNGTDCSAVGGAAGQIRGFFRLPYTFADPSPAYIDDADVTASTLPPLQMLPGSTAGVTIAARNRGSTTWTRAAGYRLGSQAPQDSTTWGTNRVDLPASMPSVDPEQTVNFQFEVIAPATAGSYRFSWQMVHEGISWFGATSRSVSVSVGSDSPVCQQLHQQHLSLVSQLNDVRDELFGLDANDPALRTLRARLSAQARALQLQISNLEAQQIVQGCAPG